MQYITITKNWSVISSGCEAACKKYDCTQTKNSVSFCETYINDITVFSVLNYFFFHWFSFWTLLSLVRFLHLRFSFDLLRMMNNPSLMNCFQNTIPLCVNAVIAPLQCSHRLTVPLSGQPTLNLNLHYWVFIDIINCLFFVLRSNKYPRSSLISEYTNSIMNGLSLRELCCLFCCPPCPSRIASKLAFLPPQPTYSFGSDESCTRYSLQLTERSEWQYTQKELDCIEVFMTHSSKGNRIACAFVRTCANAKYTILFSHGNAVDLGQMSSFYIGLSTRINCNIFSYDYSGYGISSGKPSEKNMYADINAAWQSLRSRYGISPEHIILYGQSIGTVPTVDLASRYEVGAVILHSPLMSGMRVAFPRTKRTCCLDVFTRHVKIIVLSLKLIPCSLD